MYTLALRRVTDRRYLLYVKHKHKVLDVLAFLEYDSATNLVLRHYFYKIRFWLPKLKFSPEVVQLFDFVSDGKLKIVRTGRRIQ